MHQIQRNPVEVRVNRTLFSSRFFLVEDFALLVVFLLNWGHLSTIIYERATNLPKSKANSTHVEAKTLINMVILTLTKKALPRSNHERIVFY